MTDPTPEQIEAATLAMEEHYDRWSGPDEDPPTYAGLAEAALVAAAGVTPQEPGEPHDCTGLAMIGEIESLKQLLDTQRQRADFWERRYKEATQVDEAKLAEAIAEELETDDAIAEDWSNGKLNATARRLVQFAVLPAVAGWWAMSELPDRSHENEGKDDDRCACEEPQRPQNQAGDGNANKLMPSQSDNAENDTCKTGGHARIQSERACRSYEVGHEERDAQDPGDESRACGTGR
ncbi:hypothetical protein EDF60_1667 [Leucobacter luti]|uniref:hypothetical protein n=1 Tax=Leucobacter luti TaxID=340320 RepID=UPI0010535329|nr:hypothetical protein [Leucobacter luti]MCW2287016.1 hypothetical protein [Leucobacter luti]TCK41241.1 hypothetical protein EDF60_1667 [Leucobacter luti]